MKNFIEKLVFPWKNFRRKDRVQGKKSPLQDLGNLSLVKSRPAHLSKRNYTLVEDQDALDYLFNKLKTNLLTAYGYGKYRGVNNLPRVRYEAGTIMGNRSYFYLEPWDEKGWLFERTPYGWIISRADKIVEQKTFLRGESWDAVTVFKPEGEEVFRLSSKKMGDELLSFMIYEENIKREIIIE
ncbi:MAG: hypothetical protein HQK54_07090 [Oligoflexales bacterium]|nr:hypothetical protein [Oligoflexales bacterium]